MRARERERERKRVRESKRAREREREPTGLRAERGRGAVQAASRHQPANPSSNTPTAFDASSGCVRGVQRKRKRVRDGQLMSGQK